MARRIALVGLMGTGKSTVGDVLAKRLGCAFYDLDTMVEEAARQPVSAIFQSAGEAQFRRLESDCLYAVTTGGAQEAVLATGGGVVISADNRAILRAHWLTVWLDGSVETIVQRLAVNLGDRPLLRAAENEQVLAERIGRLYDERSAWYDEVSRLRVRVDGQSIEQIVDSIVQSVRSLRCDKTRPDGGGCVQ